MIVRQNRQHDGVQRQKGIARVGSDRTRVNYLSFPVKRQIRTQSPNLMFVELSACRPNLVLISCVDHKTSCFVVNGA